METYDTYCLLPSQTDLRLPIEKLFIFDKNTVYNDGENIHQLKSSQDVAYAFHQVMKNGDHIRFSCSQVNNTEGGWLYRLDDGAAVIGLSGSIHESRSFFKDALRQYIPEGICCSYGDQPPPMSSHEFVRSSDSD